MSGLYQGIPVYNKEWYLVIDQSPSSYGPTNLVIFVMDQGPISYGPRDQWILLQTQTPHLERLRDQNKEQLVLTNLETV